MKYFLSLFLIMIPFLSLFSQDKDIVPLVKGWEYQNSKEIEQIIYKSIKDSNDKCIVIIDKSIREQFTKQLINKSNFIMGVIIINGNEKKIIFLDEYYIYKPIKIAEEIDIESIILSVFLLDEINCGLESDFYWIDVGFPAFSLIYYDIKARYYFTLDSELEPQYYEKEERFKERLRYKKIFRDLLLNYCDEMEIDRKIKK